MYSETVANNSSWCCIIYSIWHYEQLNEGYAEAVFLVVCDPSMNELWATETHRYLCIDLSRLLTAHS